VKGKGKVEGEREERERSGRVNPSRNAAYAAAL